MGLTVSTAAEKTNVPPYLAHKTLINFLHGLRRGIPSRIDKSIMGSFSGAVQGQLIATLSYFDLIDLDGKPTDLFVALVNSEGADRQRLLCQVVNRAYRFIFTSSLDLERATRKQIDELFAKQGVAGETLRKAVGVFLALAEDGGIKISPHVKPSRSRSSISHRRRSLSTIRRAKLNAPGKSRLVWSQLLLSKFPNFDPAWPESVKTRWFDSFEELMRRVI